MTSTTRRPRTTALATAGLLVGLAAGLSACGDDASDDAGGDTSAVTGSETPTDDAGTDDGDATDPATGDDGQASDEPSPSESSAPASGASDYCTEVAGLADLGNLSQTTDDDAAIDRVLATIDEIAAAAPAEVADEWATVVPAFRGYIRVIQRDVVDAENPPAGTTKEEATAANLDVIQKAVEELLPVQEEIEAIGAHAKTACGVDSF